MAEEEDRIEGIRAEVEELADQIAKIIGGRRLPIIAGALALMMAKTSVISSARTTTGKNASDYLEDFHRIAKGMLPGLRKREGSLQ